MKLKDPTLEDKLRDQLFSRLEQLEMILAPMYEVCIEKETMLKQTTAAGLFVATILNLLLRRQAFDDWMMDYVRWAHKTMRDNLSQGNDHHIN